MDSNVIEGRIATAEKYLELIDGPLSGGWGELRAYAVATRDLPIALALIHPEHWGDRVRASDLLGPREFRAQVLKGTRSCNAADYWGVLCHRHHDPNLDIVADHAWPYSLGGPTVPDNIRWLCRRHNAAKSSDIHLYPWEAPWPTWLDGLLGRVSRIRSISIPAD
jgi:hypothetical protein